MSAGKPPAVAAAAATTTTAAVAATSTTKPEESTAVAGAWAEAGVTDSDTLVDAEETPSVLLQKVRDVDGVQLLVKRRSLTLQARYVSQQQSIQSIDQSIYCHMAARTLDYTVAQK